MLEDAEIVWHSPYGFPKYEVALSVGPILKWPQKNSIKMDSRCLTVCLVLNSHQGHYSALQQNLSSTSQAHFSIKSAFFVSLFKLWSCVWMRKPLFIYKMIIYLFKIIKSASVFFLLQPMTSWTWTDCDGCPG